MLINPRLPARALFQGFFRAGGCWKSREGVHWASIPSRDPPAPAIFRARGILCLMSRTSHPTPGPAPPLRRAPRPRRRPSPRLRARYFGISTLAPPLPRTPSAQRPPKFPDGIPSGTGVKSANIECKASNAKRQKEDTLGKTACHKRRQPPAAGEARRGCRRWIDQVGERSPQPRKATDTNKRCGIACRRSWRHGAWGPCASPWRRR